MKFGVGDFAVEALPDGDGDVFGGGDARGELGDFEVEVAMVVDVDNFALEDVFELLEIDDKAGEENSALRVRRIIDLVVRNVLFQTTRIGCRDTGSDAESGWIQGRLTACFVVASLPCDGFVDAVVDRTADEEPDE